MTGRSAKIKVTDSDLYLMRSGDSSNVNMCYFDIENTRIHLHYYNDVSNDKVISPSLYNYELHNCSFMIDDGVTLSDIIDSELPFRRWRITSQKWLDIYGKYINNQYWTSFSDELDSTTFGAAIYDFNYDKSKLITNYGVYSAYRKLGPTTYRPDDSGHLHLLCKGATYYDTTTNSLLVWDGSNWV